MHRDGVSSESSAGKRNSLLHLDYLADFLRNAGQPDRGKLVPRLNGMILQLLGHASYIDVYGKSKLDDDDDDDDEQDQDRDQDQDQDQDRKHLAVPPGRRWRLVERSTWYARQRPLWRRCSRLILAVYLLASLHLIVNLYFQYAYDFDQMRLIRLRALSRRDPLTQADFSHRAGELLARLHETRAWLDLVGAHHKHLSIAIECLYLHVLVFCFIVYFLGQLFYRLVAPFELHFGRELLDGERERRHSRKLVESLALRHIESNRIFAGILRESSISLPVEPCRRHLSLQSLEPINEKVPATGESRFSGRSFRLGNPTGESVQPDQNGRLIENTLEQLLRSGALRPFNKSPAWTRKRNLALISNHLGIFAYSLLVAVVLIKASFNQRDSSEPLTWNELLMVASTLSLIAVSFMPINLFGAYFFAASFDQIVMVYKVHGLVADCIERNCEQFNKLLRHGAPYELDEARSRPMGLARVMNTNYLFALMHYKIFAAQNHATRRTTQFGNFFISALVLLIPVTIRLHIPYLNFLDVYNVKWFAIAVSITVLVPTNLTLIPNCHFHACCNRLYRVMSSLLAHTIEIESHPRGFDLYDQHTVSLLLKELRHADKFMGQFEANLLGLRSTYTALLKLHFWWGLVVLSILFDRTTKHSVVLLSEGGFLSSLFSDPFEVFSS